MSDTPQKGDAAPPSAERPAEADAASSKPIIATGSEALSVGDRGVRQQSKPSSPLQVVLGTFAPNRIVSPRTMQLIAIVEIVIALLVWLNSPFKVLPRPLEVLSALRSLIQHGLAADMAVSFGLN